MKINISLLIWLMCGITNLPVAAQINVSEYYNQGIDYFQKGDMAEARYNLEMYKLIRPYDIQVKKDLEIVKTNLEVDIIEIEPFFLSKWVNGVSNLFLPQTWRFASIFIMILMILFGYFKWVKFSTSSWTSKWILIVLISMLSLTIFTGINRQNNLFRGKHVIVFDDSLPLKQGPDEVSVDLKKIGKGNKLEILEEIDEWFKVSALDKEQGWIRKKAVRRLHFSK